MSTHLDFATLNELLDGELSRPAADAARAHLMACAACARSFAGLQGAAAAFIAVKTPALPPGFDARVRAALVPAPFPVAAFAALGALALALVAGALAAAWAWLGQPSPAELAGAARLFAARGLLLARKSGLFLDLALAAAAASRPAVSPLQLCAAVLLSAPIIVSLNPRRIRK